MSGKLNKILSNGSIQLAATVPANVTYSSLNVVVSNPLAVVCEAEVWFSDAQTPGTVDYIQPKVTIPAGGALEIYGRLASPGENVFVRATAGAAVRVESADEILPL